MDSDAGGANDCESFVELGVELGAVVVVGGVVVCWAKDGIAPKRTSANPAPHNLVFKFDIDSSPGK
jgi:hypothetical protein